MNSSLACQLLILIAVHAVHVLILGAKIGMFPLHILVIHGQFHFLEHCDLLGSSTSWNTFDFLGSSTSWNIYTYGAIHGVLVYERVKAQDFGLAVVFTHKFCG